MQRAYNFGIIVLLIILSLKVSAQIGIVDAHSQQKPKFVVLGSYHFANPGLDVAKSTVDDILKPNRQKEIEQLVARLEKYQPTKIVVEINYPAAS